MRWLIGLVALAACGRVGFDSLSPGALGGDADGDANGMRDGALGDGVIASTDGRPADGFLGACPIPPTAPDPLVLSGNTIRLLTGTTESGVTLSVATSEGGAAIASTTSGGNGSYTLDVPTGGVPTAMWLTVSGANLIASISEPEQPFYQNLVLEFFTGPVSDLDSVYGDASLTRDNSKGSLYVSVNDCSLAPVAGAVITTTPPAQVLYANTSGQPDASLTATTSAGLGLVLNVDAGTVQLGATAAGMTFVDEAVDVVANPKVTSKWITRLP